MNALALQLETSLPIKEAAVRRDLGRGGTTLWKHEGDGFAVVVFQLHDEPFARWGLDEDEWDMIELRVLSARTNLAHFWDKEVDRVTHWKKSWTLYNMEPTKDAADLAIELKSKKVRWEWWDFDRYEEDFEKAIVNAEKAVQKLEALKKRTVGTFKPWAVALKADLGDSTKDKFWAVAVYADDFQWVVKIDRGMMKAFGFIYPRYWEIGYRFDNFRKADSFAKDKMRYQMGKGYAQVTDPKTLRIMKWSLKAAEAADDANPGST